jgi:glucose-1-phosphate cytidylyltransferase
MSSGGKGIGEMKAVILAGGRGSRISAESDLRPKPMITIGGKPILIHIMNIYASWGITDFVICLGYKGHVIKEYFANFLLHSSPVVEFDLASNTVSYDRARTPGWKVTLVETGNDTQTGGRIKRIAPLVERQEAFCLTYGDGLSNIDVSALVAHHRHHGLFATVTTVAPPGRFGAVQLQAGRVKGFVEKPAVGDQIVNGGFFVLSPKVLDYIAGDETIWEREPLQTLAAEGQLSAYQHDGFWQPMDTLRERDLLEQQWATGKAPWAKGPA